MADLPRTSDVRGRDFVGSIPERSGYGRKTLHVCELACRASRLVDVILAGAFQKRKVERLGDAFAEIVPAAGSSGFAHRTR